jgi:ABC-type dipeptide/oligopeptide/nickel transport system permease component
VTTFIIRRIATIVPTLIFVSLLIFGLQQLLPGDPAMILAGEERDPTVIAYLHQKLHLDEPFPSATCTGCAACCTAIWANRCGCNSRCAD